MALNSRLGNIWLFSSDACLCNSEVIMGDSVWRLRDFFAIFLKHLEVSTTRFLHENLSIFYKKMLFFVWKQFNMILQTLLLYFPPGDLLEMPSSHLCCVILLCHVPCSYIGFISFYGYSAISWWNIKLLAQADFWVTAALQLEGKVDSTFSCQSDIQKHSQGYEPPWLPLKGGGHGSIYLWPSKVTEDNLIKQVLHYELNFWI